MRKTPTILLIFAYFLTFIAMFVVSIIFLVLSLITMVSNGLYNRLSSWDNTFYVTRAILWALLMWTSLITMARKGVLYLLCNIGPKVRISIPN